MDNLFGVSVTQRIKQIKQPRGGYLNPKVFVQEIINDDEEFFDKNEENLNPALVGMAVDYLTRFMENQDLEESFKISIMGASILGKLEIADKLLSEIQGLDDQSIINAVKMTGFDVAYRYSSLYYKDVEEINPNEKTIEHIKKMVERSIIFLNLQGNKVLDGFNFPGGYSDIVTSGDGDFITENTIWDFKVSARPITKEYTLQLLMYWRMGLKSDYDTFSKIQYLGIFNPRNNTIYKLNVNEIDQNIIKEVEQDVIGY